MRRTFRWFLLSAAGLLLAAGSSRAQMGSDVSVPTIASFEDRNGPLLVGNPYLDGPRNNLGWFATLEVSAVGSHVQNQLIANVAVGPKLEQVRLPAADLSWTAMPRLEIGYRCGEGAGELLVSYRFLGTSGSATTSGFDTAGNAGALRSRLAMNVIDLDYASQEPSLAPWFQMKWRFGVRLAGLFFDSEEASPLLQQHVTNNFWGAGPHAGLELWRPIADSRVALFGKIDVAGVYGLVQQGFEETAGPVSGFTRQTQNMPTAMLMVQAGASWTPRDNLRVSVGYTYEHWWDAAFAGASRGDVWMQGVFIRGEWKY